MNSSVKLLAVLGGLALWGEVGFCAEFAFRSAALVDTVSLNPSGTLLGTGYDSFVAGTSTKVDYAYGFALKVAYDCEISVVEFLVSQQTPGETAHVLIYKGAARSKGGDFGYWLPMSNAKPLAVFDLVTPLPPAGDTSFHVFRFRSNSPFKLTANTPYVVVFDPVPTGSGGGAYVLANIPKDWGYLSSAKASESDIVMPSFLIRRVTDLSSQVNQWQIARNDRRYAVAVLVPEPVHAALGVALLLLLCGFVKQQAHS